MRIDRPDISLSKLTIQFQSLQNMWKIIKIFSFKSLNDADEVVVIIKGNSSIDRTYSLIISI